MPAAKKAAATKAPAKKVTAKAKAPVKKAASKAAPVSGVGDTRKADRVARDAELTTGVVKMRNEGEKWEDVAKAHGISPGKAQILYMRNEAGTSSESATPAKVMRDRDKGEMSWPSIAAKYGSNKSAIQKLYREAGGDPHASYVGRGGRYFNHEEKVSRMKTPKTKATTKSTPAKKAAVKKEAASAKAIFTDPDNATTENVTTKIQGKTITWKSDKAATGVLESKVVRVDKVGREKSGKRVVQFSDGNKTRVAALEAIIKVTR